ncbi:tetratricopeptide repeat protein [Streptomyces sp. NPDC127039]|uniref:serine/threonine-protein kinase n=1 Tax=Streptomyces sp. NPDC127039 TaxID=3347115 RepID=UPI0036663B5F
MEALAADDPRQIGPYALRRRLGEGGMGRVYLGTSPSGRAVAVKVIHPNLACQADFRRRFGHEVAAVRSVSGAFTAPIVGAETEGDPPWLATVYVPGPDLASAVAQTGPLPLQSLWPLAAGLTEALQAIHAARVLHRDIKPSNVLLAADGPRLIDFGIARAVDGTALTTTGMVMGTPGFMSPEQIDGAVQGPASDVFALGAVLTFAATGVGPFGEGQPLALLRRIVDGTPRLDDVPDGFRDLVGSCLAKEPGDRPTLTQILQTIDSAWSPPEQDPTTTPWSDAITRLLSHHAPPSSGPQPTGAATAGSTTQEPTRRYTEAQQTAKAGGPLAAARLMEQLAADQARTLGPDHPDTLHSRHHQALYLGRAGREAEVAVVVERVAADRARVLGRDHPDTLQSRHNLAMNLSGAGRHAEAAELMERVAADRARVLGQDHPATLHSRHNHALYLGRAGREAEAAVVVERVAVDRARVLGRDHPATLQSRHNLAMNLGRSGRHAEAAEVAERVAADRARVLGPDHPDTLHSRHEHAWNVSRVGQS